MEFVEVNSRRKPPRPRRLYRVALVRVDDDIGTSEILGIHETWAVSEAQACNNVRHRLGRRSRFCSETVYEYFRILKDSEQPNKPEETEP